MTVTATIRVSHARSKSDHSGSREDTHPSNTRYFGEPNDTPQPPPSRLSKSDTAPKNENFSSLLWLAKLTNCVLLIWADQEQFKESPELEQAHDFAGHSTKSEFAFPLFGGPVGKD